MPDVLLDSFSTGEFGHSWRFSGHVRTVSALTPEEVVPVLAAAEDASRHGLYAVGFVAYEAATALNPHLPSLPPREGLPLVWFALFRERYASTRQTDQPGGTTESVELHPVLSPSDYCQNVEAIRQLIAQGDSYQINYTFPLMGRFAGDPLALYHRVCCTQQAPFNAYLDMGRHVIISASPELFFFLKNGSIATRPMKGTIPRGRWPDEDRQLADSLAESPKERAENLMIVDLLRNDLGQIAVTGSVTVEQLFSVERYPTVHQMTSTVTAQLPPEITVVDIFRALFPCGSVTGAPKRRSMEIIQQVEGAPRGVYCGAIGYLAPGGEALFSVGIRTLVLDWVDTTVTLGVGSGITWDSAPLTEYAECLAKAAFVTAPIEPFHLIETLRHDQDGFHRLDGHMSRMAASAEYFGFPFDRASAVRLLEQQLAENRAPRRVRLTLSERGEMAVETIPLLETPTPLRLAIALTPVASSDRFRFHKTTRRTLLDEARLQSGLDEVLFVNERGELTEGSYHTLVVRLGGRLVTPPITAGLLPGVLREELLAAGTISEQTLYPADLIQAEEIWLINSLRGWRTAHLVEGALR